MILFNSAFWCIVMFIRIPMVLVSKLDTFTNNVDIGFFLWIPEGQMPGYGVLPQYRLPARSQRRVVDRSIRLDYGLD